MPGFNNMTSRQNAAALIPEPIAREIINGTRKQSVFMQLATRLPNMISATQKQPVLSMLPQADFINGDVGMKTTTNLAWDKVTMVVGEMAVILPVPQAVIADAEYDIWGEAQGPVVEAFGRTLDRATLYERNPKAPAEWPEPIIPAAIAKGNIVRAGTGMDIAEDISNLFGKLEENEFEVTALAAQRRMRTMLRNMRTTTGEPLYTPLTGTNPALIYGVPVSFAAKGTWEPSAALALAGDWSNIVYAMRQDMTFQFFDTGVINDEDGKIIFNLMQQDMVAMRVVMRLAWAVADAIDIDRPRGTTYPVAVLQPSL